MRLLIFKRSIYNVYFQNTIIFQNCLINTTSEINFHTKHITLAVALFRKFPGKLKPDKLFNFIKYYRNKRFSPRNEQKCFPALQ